MTFRYALGSGVLVVALVVRAFAAATPNIVITPDPADSIYAVGDVIKFHITTAAGGIVPGDLHYQFLHDGNDAGAPVLPLELKEGEATVSTPAKANGTITLKVAGKNAAGVVERYFTGAAIAPFDIKPAATRPADFDAFWKHKIAELNQIPMAAVEKPILLPASAKAADLDYEQITLANINGSHVYGQLARPHAAGTYPAMLIFQGAGVYGLPTANVTTPAHEGWLALNIMAHDLPIDLPAEKYRELEQGALKNYGMIGNTDRDKSYFVRMILGDYRAAEYLTSRPDWNGQVFLSTGKSQGGLQAVATAALHPKVTHLITWITAGCDTCGNDIGRTTPFPGWYGSTTAANRAVIMANSCYFDPVNFASAVHVPSLVCLGLADLIAPPTGIFAMYNQLGGPKEIRIAPAAAHTREGKSHDRFDQRTAEWTQALTTAQPIPPTTQP